MQRLIDTHMGWKTTRGFSASRLRSEGTGRYCTPLAFLSALLITGCGGGSADTDAGASATRSPSMNKQAATTVLNQDTTVPVQAADILYNFSASNPDTYKHPTLQCQGANHYFWRWAYSAGEFINPPPNPLRGVAPDGSTFDAFSTVPSPGEPEGAAPKSAFRWELRATDPDTAGTNAKRCEFSLGWKEYSYPGRVFTRQIGLPANEDYWWAVDIQAEDWTATASNDWQSLWQWHDAYGGGLPPFLALLTHGNEMLIELTYDLNSKPSHSTLQRRRPWVIKNWTPNKWMRFIVKARKDLVNPANSYVSIWLDGTQIVDYHGPFGYNVPQMDYAKVGIYHWLSTANKWDPSVPSRVMYSKGPVQVRHQEGYSWQSINQLLD